MIRIESLDRKQIERFGRDFTASIVRPHIDGGRPRIEFHTKSGPNAVNQMLNDDKDTRRLHYSPEFIDALREMMDRNSHPANAVIRSASSLTAPAA